MRVTTRTNQSPVGRIFGSIIMVIMGIALVMVSSYMTKQGAAVNYSAIELPSIREMIPVIVCLRQDLRMVSDHTA